MSDIKLQILIDATNNASAKLKQVSADANSTAAQINNASKAVISAQGDMNKYSKAMDIASGKSGGLRGAMSGLTGQFAIGSLVATGVTAAINILQQSLSNAFNVILEAEKANNLLAGSLRRIGADSPQAKAAVDAFADSMQKLYNIDDDVAKIMAGRLLQAGTSWSDTQKIMKLSADAAAAGVGDFQSNVEALTQSISTGTTRGLKALGLATEETTLTTEGLSKAFEQGNKMYGGQATDAINTTSGAMTELGNAWDDVIKKMGSGTTGPFKDVIKAGTWLVENVFPRLTAVSVLPFQLILSSTKLVGKSLYAFGELLVAAFSFDPEEMQIAWDRVDFIVKSTTYSMTKNVKEAVQTILHGTTAAVAGAGSELDKHNKTIIGKQKATGDELKKHAKELAEALRRIQEKSAAERLQIENIMFQSSLAGQNKWQQKRLEEERFYNEQLKVIANMQYTNIVDMYKAIEAANKAHQIEMANIDKGEDKDEQDAKIEKLKSQWQGLQDVVGGFKQSLEAVGITMSTKFFDNAVKMVNGITAISNGLKALGALSKLTAVQWVMDMAKQVAATGLLIIKTIALAAIKAASSMPFPLNIAVAGLTIVGLKKAIAGFDDPSNDAVGYRWGKDLGTNLMKGLTDTTGAPGFGHKVVNSLKSNIIMSEAPSSSGTVIFQIGTLVGDERYTKEVTLPMLERFARNGLTTLATTEGRYGFSPALR
jgi:hypothetical protein